MGFRDGSQAVATAETSQIRAAALAKVDSSDSSSASTTRSGAPAAAMASRIARSATA